MIASERTARQSLRAAPSRSSCAVLKTALKWMAVEFRGEELAGLSFGHPQPAACLAALDLSHSGQALTAAQRDMVSQLKLLAAGKFVDTTSWPLYPHWRTPFAKRVIAICRSIPAGETLSYSELAARAGSPAAARAVGNVMATNRIPLVVPCHRVVGAGGALGGYSAPGGLAVKRMLLERERCLVDAS